MLPQRKDIDTMTKIVVIGDLHGDLPRAIQLLLDYGVIAWRHDAFAWTFGSNVVVQLGDQLDGGCRRSGGSDKCMRKETDDTAVVYFMTHVALLASKAGGRVVNLMGNHELYVATRGKFMPGYARLRAHLIRHRQVACVVEDTLFCHAGLLPCLASLVDDVGDIDAAFLWKMTGALPSRLPKQSAQESERYYGAIFDNVIDDGDGIMHTRHYSNENTLSESRVRAMLTKLGVRHMVIGHNTVDKVTSLFGGSVMLCDVGLSRAYARPSWNAPTMVATCSANACQYAVTPSSAM